MAYPGAVPASVGKRVLAYVIDMLAASILGGAFLVAGSMQAASASADGRRSGGAIVLTLVGVVLLLAFGVVQWWYHGRKGVTLGKALVGLRTLDADTGQPIGMERVLLRALVVAASSLAFGIGQLVMLASPLFDSGGRRQGWHDKAARALVVDVVTGVDPARARASEATAAARLDGLLAPVAAVDLPPAPLPPAPLPPAPPAAGTAVPLPPPPLPAPTNDLWSELAGEPAGPTAPDFLAPFPAAVPPPPGPAEPVTPGLPEPPPRRPARHADGGTGVGEPATSGATYDDDSTGLISVVPGVRPVVPGGPPPLEPTVLVDHIPDGLAPAPARGGGPATVAGTGLVDGAPGEGRPTDAAPVEGDLPEGGPTDADLDDGDLDDVEATRLSFAGSARGRRATDVPARAVLHLWNGQEVPVTGFILLGRNPARREDELLPERIVTVPDERRSVSKTHLAAGVDGAGLWVRDRGSTNGTVVTLPDGAQVICAPGQQVRVPVGATVSFGDFWFTVS